VPGGLPDVTASTADYSVFQVTCFVIMTLEGHELWCVFLLWFCEKCNLGFLCSMISQPWVYWVHFNVYMTVCYDVHVTT